MARLRDEMPATGASSRRRATSASIAAAAAVALLLATAVVASAGTIGRFSFTGQLKGTAMVPQVGHIKEAGVPVPLYGCKVGQESTMSLLNFFTLKLALNGHPATETSVEGNIAVAKTGDSESLTSANPDTGFRFSVTVGTKSYNWTAVSGTITTKPGNNGGSVNAQLVPSGKVPGQNDPLESGAATAPIHVTGSWSSCTAWNK
jgi:hypothetical protein